VCAGAPVVVPDSTAVLMAYLGGQGMGGAVAALLFGDKNPCGRLAETFPKYVEDLHCHINFPGDGVTVRYGEGMNVGYRGWRHTSEPQYTFGHGLSYTAFEYSDMNISGGRGGNVSVSAAVANVGEYDGKEVVQLYVNGELKGFTKIHLEKGGSKTVTIELTPRAFSFWDVQSHSWQIRGGEYWISFKDSGLPLDDMSQSVTLDSTLPPATVTMMTQVKALWRIPNGRGLFDEICGLFKVEPTEELVNTRDCSLFVGNMLKNMVTMFDLGWTFADLQERIDKINELNGV
jgi:beta-glucosidase